MAVINARQGRNFARAMNQQAKTDQGDAQVLVLSIPSVGKVMASTLLSALPELGKLSCKQISALPQLGGWGASVRIFETCQTSSKNSSLRIH
ncbi:MAG: hypothetical protein HC781_21360 [Leptolyngbyaceae cyanobacterium CSU_1_4]|nr:hypothetical protein [Leptolyngbyaceae cyanobacterium CSU_1_4]